MSKLIGRNDLMLAYESLLVFGMRRIKEIFMLSKSSPFLIIQLKPLSKGKRKRGQNFFNAFTGIPSIPGALARLLDSRALSNSSRFNGSSRRDLSFSLIL